jgi:uncharacterized membrane protein
MLDGIVGLFVFGLVIVIVIQFVKKGSAGPKAIDAIFNGVSTYITDLK